MTYEEIKASDKMYLVSTDIAEIMRAQPYRIMCQARAHPELMPFPVVRIGKITKFPRYGVLKYCEEVLGMGKEATS